MRNGIAENHVADSQGNPAGGTTSGIGISISWQNGPLGRGAERSTPNGAFVEDVIAAAAGRIRFYESSKFACEENADALRHLEAALAALESRTARRESAGVEGTHGGN